MEAFIGSIILFSGNFAPTQWALAQGQLLAISSNSALFAILGTTFGGNGTSTFQLPNLASRVPLGAGQSPGLSNYVLGEQGGVETTTLLISNLPAHTHAAQATFVGNSTVNALSAVPATGLLPSPIGHYWANAALSGGTPTPVNSFGDGTAGSTVQMIAGEVVTTASGTVVNSVTGSGIPMATLQPFQAMSYIIALFGIFPTRN